MTKGFLRGLVGVFTLPFVFGIYWVLWFVLIALGADNSGEFTDNLWSVGAVWILFLVFYPVVSRLLDKVVK